MRYLKSIEGKVRAILERNQDARNDDMVLYRQMGQADKESIWYQPTEKAKEYRAFEREMRNKMYSEIAERCGEYDHKYKNRDLER